MKDKVRFALKRKGKTPCRAHKFDAGIDIFVPEDFPATKMKIGDAINIPTGLYMDVKPGYCVMARHKSGIATKKGLILLANTIDTDYQGEIFVTMAKVTGDEITVEPGDKIVQLITVPIETPEVEMVEFENLYQSESERGSGGFGSTGDK